MGDLLLVTGDLSPADRDAVLDAAGGSDVTFADSPAQALDQLPRCRAVIGHLDPEQLELAARLEWVHSWVAGPDRQLSDAMRRSAVTLTSSAGNGGVPLAEHAMMLMLMLDRDAPRWLKAQRERRWDRFVHGELYGRTVGIIGLGNSGLDLARKAQAFGMYTLGLRRRPLPASEAVDECLGPADLHTLLARSDFVVVTAPRTPHTVGLLGKAEFDAMPRTSFFICVSRGGIADDGALLEALRTGSIAGAGIDAHGIEPLPSDSGFWDLPNVILTPHNGATTEGTQRRGVRIMIENVRRFTRGDALLNVVDKDAGY